MKKIFILFFIIIAFPFVNKAQDENNTIAKIGDISITEKEFRTRFELTPHLWLQQNGTQEAVKKTFLYSLIAEKLFALDAINSMLDTNEIVKYTLHTYEKMFVRDALYKKEIKDEAKYKADSLLSKYIDEASEFWFTYIFSEDESEADKIHSLLEKGIPFDSLYSELKSGDDTIKLRIGDLDESIETKLTSLREGGYSTTLYFNDEMSAGRKGWYICKIVKKDYPILAKMSGWETEYKRLEKISEERAEKYLYQDFMNGFFEGKQINANGALLRSIAEKISLIFNAKSKAKTSEEEEMFLNTSDLLKIEMEFDNDSLNLPYIYLDGGIITLKDFLRYLRFEDFTSSKHDFQVIAAIVNSKTKKFIEQELLAAEGYKQGLQNSAEVKESYNMWRDNYLFHAAQINFTDSAAVSNEALEESGLKKPVEVKIIEILTDSLETVEKILDELRENADMHDLAKKYSKRTSTKSSNGEIGFFPVTMYGEIGRVAGEMLIGEIYGPLKVPEGYSIFKLIEKREKENSPAGSQDFGNISEYKKQAMIVNRTADLAVKYGLTINEEFFRSIKLTSINSLVYRYLGFGSKLTAVPLIAPYTEWVGKWKEKLEVIQ